ncbi:GxxExxY protein [Aerophototrophica crusticola]
MEAITEAILGAAFDVSHHLGAGFLENLYKRALLKELRLRRLAVQEEVPFQVRYKGEPIGTYFADLLVERQVIVELKVAEAINDAHVHQVVNYLKASGLRVGLILNFGVPRVAVRRVLL